MLASYHLMFTAATLILFFLGLCFLYLWNKKYEWGNLIGFVLLSFNVAICWISVLGFHGIQFVGYNGADFEIFTYPEMWSLNVVPYVMIFLSILFMVIRILLNLNIILVDMNTKESRSIRLPKSDRAYWKK